MKERKDQNGTVHAFDRDKLGRQTHDRVTTLGSGVDGAVRRISRTFEVRGLPEKITSYDNATVGSGSVVNEIQMAYNNFGQLATEYQEHGGAVNTSTSPKVQHAHADGSANHTRRTSVTYPNGRKLRYEFNLGIDDNASRVSFLADDNSGSVGTHLAEYVRLGTDDIIQIDLAEPDLRHDLAMGSGDDPYDSAGGGGLDRFDRVVDSLWRNYGTSTDVDRIKHGYDRASNRTYRENTVSKAQGTPVNLDELYGYDGLSQLKRADRGVLNANKDAISSGALNFAQDWALDATGNWATFKEDSDGDTTWNLDQPRTHNKANEITIIGATTGPNWVDPVHDRAGNMTTIPQPAAPTTSYAGTWDAWNRLVKLMDGANTVLTNAFDGLNRRTKKVIGATTRHFYFSDRWQVLEERLNTSSSADRQFVWGLRYIDDLVLRDRNADGNAGTGNLGIASSGLEERLYALQDPNWNVVALADSSGAIQERYTYTPYGVPSFHTPTFAARTAALYDVETLFAGYRWDGEVGLYLVRNRCLGSALGRWVSRDPVYLSDGSNAFVSTLSAPPNHVDPSGLTTFVGPHAIIEYFDWELVYSAGDDGSVTAIGQSGRLKIRVGRDQSIAKQHGILMHELTAALLGRFGYLGDVHGQGTQNMSLIMELAAVAEKGPIECTCEYARKRYKTAQKDENWATPLKRIVDFICDCAKGLKQGRRLRYSQRFSTGYLDKETLVLSIVLECKDKKVARGISTVTFIDCNC